MKKRISILLILVLTLCLALSACGSGDTIVGGAKPSGEAELDPNKQVISFTIGEIKKFAETSSNIWEFTQRFFKDQIVYKDASGSFAYEPVNTEMPLSNYNYDNLVNVALNGGKEYEYRENGVTTSVKGIDVSQYQGDIDWDLVAGDGVKFAFVRLGYRGYGTGKLVTDKNFDTNMAGALKSNISVGVYFLSQAVSVEEAVEEAKFVIESIKPYKVTWPIVLDMEEAGGSSSRTYLLTAEERTTYVKAFCDTIKKAGYEPMIYANIGWFMSKMNLEDLTEYDKWFAQYFNRPFFPYAYSIWQYTDKGQVNGIKGDVDFDISFVDFDAKD